MRARHIGALLALAALIACGMSASAQNLKRRWALEGSIAPTITKVNIDSKKVGSRNETGFASYVGAEYFIPASHFSVRLGYRNESLSIGADDFEVDLSSVSVGGKWYPAPERCWVQPHVGLGMNVLVADDYVAESHQSINGVPSTILADINTPKVAFVPSVGLDIHFISSVALTIDYSYTLGINNGYKYNVDTGGVIVPAHGNLNHHSVNFGLKVTFPFRFTADDGTNLINSIISNIFYNRRR